MATYGYPTGAELTVIGQEFTAAMTLDDPIFQLFPIVSVNDHLLAWEQRDNFKGLQQIRGLNGQPPRIAALGGKRYLYEPGVYGEFAPIDEQELTRRRQWGQYSGPIPIGDLVTEKQEQLTARDIGRKRFILWTLLTTGAFQVSNVHGAILHAGTFPIQTFSATVPWSTLATATPLADLRAVALLGRGHGVSFGRKATAFANQVTVNNLLKNTNASDLGGRRGVGGTTFNSLAEFNQIFLENDLPAITVMDDGYYDDSGTYQLYVPNGVVSVVGARTAGQPVGEYRLTRNANNPDGAPGDYDLVYQEEKPPMSIEVHRGHNGGPVLYYPSAVVRMNV